ncbi:MAG: PQQ-binding-like beta-propeller repeat protein [Verrucomicrobia bacterium]|nr:PQQ-binding-like beta-propeller repeat protein [Verrucomicrobiota bacterium]
MTGATAEKDLPVKWSDKDNVRWRVELPDRGNSSPIVWGNRVFVTQAIQKENRRTLMCFDRANGRLLWQSGVTYAEREPTQQNNPYCSGSPVTDGERVYVCFGSAGVYAYDFEGREAWHRDLGKINHMFGNAVSPILHGGLCFLNFGPDEKARLIALDAKTGQTVWEAEPPKVDESELQQDRPGGFAGGPGGFGGRGGPGGRGGFGPGMMIAPQMLSQADKNSDQKLTKEEFAALADAWFDKLDADKTGKLSQEEFVEKFGDVLPPPQGFGPPGGNPPGGNPPGGGQRGGGRGGFGPARFAGPGLFTAADANKDGSLTRAELKATFEKWSSDWDADKSGSLNEEKLREGLNSALPQPNFGGPGGPAGGRGPGGGADGRGGFGGRGGPGGPGGPGGFGGPIGGSWSTPIIVSHEGHDELIVNFANRLAAYDPKTGKQLWLSKGLGGTIYATPVSGEGTIVAMSSGMMGASAIALKPGGSGEVTESHRLWRMDRFQSRTGSGIIHEGHFYSVSDSGIAECVELKTGKTVWSERLKGPGSRSSTWSSVLLADGKIYVPNQSGDVFVLRASPQFEVLSTNSVAEPTNASLAASNRELFLRTDKSLWCIANRNP